MIGFDQGEREKLKPCKFSMKPAIIAQSGKKRATPTVEQLKGSGVRVAQEQPHVPTTWQERNRAASAVIANGGPDPRGPGPELRERRWRDQPS